MATQIFGTAEFTYTSGGTQTHTLAVPLQQVRPSVRQKKWTRESINFANRETWYVPSGAVYEVVAVIRYDDSPQSLIDLLLAGAQDITVTYDDGVTTHACKIIGLPEEITVGFDELQQTEDWHRIEIRLRKTDGTAFASSIFTGS